MSTFAIPEEPVLLGEQLRNARFAGTAWGEATVDPALANWLWEQWGPTLEQAGMDREQFGSVVSTGRRECWLWLIGERQWNQYITGLAGRVRRRLPAELVASPGGDTV